MFRYRRRSNLTPKYKHKEAASFSEYILELYDGSVIKKYSSKEELIKAFEENSKMYDPGVQRMFRKHTYIMYEEINPNE